jgi:glycosyltransferase involved in cell wall biosynthesis
VELEPPPPRELFPPVIWFAPFLSGGGYCSEAIAFALGLAPRLEVQIVQHGDSYNEAFEQGLGEDLQRELFYLQHNRQYPPSSVVVCHSEPGAWALPRPKYSTTLCPPPIGALYKVGRTMFETDRLPEGWAQRLNAMDEVWVPTRFHRDVFARGGVAADKLRVVPEGVDTRRFDPEAVRDEYPLPHSEGYAFKFLSIFKWEERKGWRFLIEAFLREFAADERVALYILTNAYHSDADFARKIAEFADSLQLSENERAAARRIHLLPSGVPEEMMASLYKAADAFVLPSRGEGWGRPHVEAMAMALPVVTTLWSGPEEYLSERNGFPVAVERLEPVPDGPFRGHLWARPALSSLRARMREVVADPAAARARGREARRDMVTSYCLDCVTERVLDELRRIRDEKLHWRHPALEPPTPTPPPPPAAAAA